MEHWGFLDDRPDTGFKMKPTTQTYELTTAELTKLFSEKLGVPEARITIALRDTLESYAFNGLIVSVKSV